MKLLKTINCNIPLNFSELDILDIRILNIYNIDIMNSYSLLDILIQIFNVNIHPLISKHYNPPLINILKTIIKCSSSNKTTSILYIYTYSKIYKIILHRQYIIIKFTYDLPYFIRDNSKYYYSDYKIINAYKFLNLNEKDATWFDLL